MVCIWIHYSFYPSCLTFFFLRDFAGFRQRNFGQDGADNLKENTGRRHRSNDGSSDDIARCDMRSCHRIDHLPQPLKVVFHNQG